MQLLSLATASPDQKYTQKDCYDIFIRSSARHRLKDRSVKLMEKVLLRDNGIETRRFCYPDMDTIFDADPEKLNNVFEKEATLLGASALYSAMQRASLIAGEIDALLVCTCTGYLCPGLSSHIAEKCGLKSGCELTDISGMGCGAAIPTLRQAANGLAANPQMKVAVVAVEVCSAAFYLDDNPDVIISACLFGDGAAAAIWTGPGENGSGWQASGFKSLHVPEDRQLLRFENAKGALRNRLSRKVPEAAANCVRTLYDQSISEGITAETAYILPHSGGRDVLDAMNAVVSQEDFPESRKVLRNNGNMSSPSVLFALQEYLENLKDTGDCRLWLTSFGAGFTAYSMNLERR